MGQVLALQDLIASRQLWRGRATAPIESAQPTGLAALDRALPTGGWPEAALTEILLPVDGVGEIDLLVPTLVRLTRARRIVVLVAPPYVPYPPGWQARGVCMSHVQLVDAEPTQALWALEQCLRSGSCGAVIGWPLHIDHAGLRRLQVAAKSGNTLGFVMRDRRHAMQASPAALRLEITVERAVVVRKCRGGAVPTRTYPIPMAQ